MLSQNRDTDPDWREVCEAVAAPGVRVGDLMERLAAKEDQLGLSPDLARKRDVPDAVVTSANTKNEEMANGVAKLRNVPTYG